jgi:hypothetical protein
MYIFVEGKIEEIGKKLFIWFYPTAYNERLKLVNLYLRKRISGLVQKCS